MNRQSGFSLVELLFALLVLTLVIMTGLAVFTERSKRLQQANEIMLAYQALANEAEMQRRVAYNDLFSTTSFQSETDLLAPLKPFSTRIEVNQSKAGIKDVTMIIRWRNGERVAKLTLTRVDTGGGNLW
jgi:prepilin-type N-terminal cleavage/methylation domain-containing protein